MTDDGLVDIRKAIDSILEKHKAKMDDLHAKKTDLKKLSFKDKQGKTLYYLRKTDKKKAKKEGSLEELSEKIIFEAKSNLGENPDKTDAAAEKNDKKDGFKENEIKEKTEETDKKIDDFSKEEKSPDLSQSKEFDNEFNSYIQAENDKIENDVKINSVELKNDVTDKSDEIVDKNEKTSFFNRKKGKKKTEEKKKEGDFISSSTNDLAGMKKKYNDKIEFIDKGAEIPIEEINKDESEILDHKIKTDSTEKNVEDDFDEAQNKAFELAQKHLKNEEQANAVEKPKKEEQVNVTEEQKREEQTETKKQKKSLFNRKKLLPVREPIEDKKETKVSDKTETQVEKFSEAKISDQDESRLLDDKIRKTDQEADILKKEKSAPNKETVDKQVKPEIDERIIKPMFRVENLPARGVEDEADMLNEKIREAQLAEKKPKMEDDVEEKAKELAKEHIKKHSFIKPKEQILPKEEKKDDTDNIIGNPLKIEDSEHEHVFFDESEEIQGGWSPHLSDDDKKKMSVPFKADSGLITEEIKDSQDLELPKTVLQNKSVSLSELGFSEHEWEELDFYPLRDPFAFVEILREKESLDKCYFLVEIELTEDEEKLLGFIQETMMRVSFDTDQLESDGDDKYLTKILEQVLEEYNVNIKEESKEKIIYYIGKSALGLGKLDPVMLDPNIEDISCDGAGVPLFLYHRTYGSLKSNIKFDDEEELSSFIFRLAEKCGKHISIAEPMLDATMPDGSRIQMTLSDEITAKGSTFTIRKFREDPFSPPDLVEFNTMSSEMIAYMWLAVENGINTLFAGGTASGKTTTLNALTLFIPREAKIVSIEETREINLPHPNWIPGVARSGFGEVVANKVVGQIDMYDLMKAALRQRPEYILVGEIRGREAYVLFQAMATGHATYSTVHADSAQSLIHRLEGKPINIPRVMLQSLDVVCLHVITRVKDKRARRCKQIIEIIDIDPTTKEILTNEVFRWDPVEDIFVYSGKSYVLERIRAEKDMTREDMTDEIRKRKEIVEWMNNTNVREFRGVANIVSRYMEDPLETYKQIKKEAKE